MKMSILQNCIRSYLNWYFPYISDGKSLAMKYGVKYIETSPGINHNVDELLGMFSHKISLITIFGHKHLMQKFLQKFDILYEKIFNSLWFVSYLA